MGKYRWIFVQKRTGTSVEQLVSKNGEAGSAQRMLPRRMRMENGAGFPYNGNPADARAGGACLIFRR
ncbi:MAG: hypothetical protein ACFN27_01635 [Prevotella sp.]